MMIEGLRHEEIEALAKTTDAPELLLLELGRRGCSTGVQTLIDRNVNVNVTNERGMTALHMAAANGARNLARPLVASGRCDYMIKDIFNRYAFQLAIEWGRDYALGRLLAKKQAQQAYALGVPGFEK